VLEQLAQKPERTLAELHKALELDCTLQAIHYVLEDRGCHIKTLHASEQQRQDVAKARARWHRQQASIDPARLVFLDESAAKTNMTTRLRDQCQRGKQLHFACPNGHWRTTTMICSMRLDGSTVYMTIDGATDTEVFRAYLREVLLPTLKVGDIVMIDNLTPHKNDQTLALLEAAGVQVWFLPAHLPGSQPHRNGAKQGQTDFAFLGAKGPRGVDGCDRHCTLPRHRS
jgi:hypothetical protein